MNVTFQQITRSMMAQLHPFIHFNGNAEEAFIFYRSVFGGDFTTIIRFKDLNEPSLHLSENEANKIMKISLAIGANGVLMGSDVPEMFGQINENENRNKIWISAGSKEEADHFFAGLSAGGNIEVPISNSPWGSYFGMFRDKYGVEWMIDFALNPELPPQQ